MARNPEHDASQPGDTSEENTSYEQARKLTEEALDAYVDGNPEQGDRLAEEAKNTNSQAVQEVVEELEEDKDSDHESYVGTDKNPKQD